MGLLTRDRSRDPALTDAFARYATVHGFEHRGLFPEVTIRGTADGVMFTYAQWQQEEAVDVNGDRRQRTVWRCRAFVEDAARLEGLAVDDQHALHRFLKWFGAQDVTLGWPEFDEAFVVKARDEARARQLLTPAACQALLDARRAGVPVYILNGKVEHDLVGINEDVPRADAAMRAVVRVAAWLGR